MKLSFMPNTKQGKLSTVFIIFAIVDVVLINVLAMIFGFPEKGVQSFHMSILLGIITFVALTSVIISALNGLKAIIEGKERTVLVFICI